MCLNLCIVQGDFSFIIPIPSEYIAAIFSIRQVSMCKFWTQHWSPLEFEIRLVTVPRLKFNVIGQSQQINLHNFISKIANANKALRYCNGSDHRWKRNVKTKFGYAHLEAPYYSFGSLHQSDFEFPIAISHHYAGRACGTNYVIKSDDYSDYTVNKCWHHST